MGNNILFLLVIGLALIGMVALPKLLRNLPLTIPILYVLLGTALFSLPLDLPRLEPVFNSQQRMWTEYITELIVIISLFGVGVRIDRRPGWRSWKSGLLLIAITMPLCIAAIAWVGWWALALTPAAAILLGAVLAPTDPVLAATAQVGPPGEGDENEVQFALTLEAGINDGLAFPFVYLALALSDYQSLSETITQWVLYDLLYRVGMGVLGGIVLGYVLVRIFFYVADQYEKAEFKGGLYVIAAVFLSYSITELVGGYGFLAAFVAGVVGRNYKYDSKHHYETVLYLEEIEQLILALLLISLGGLVANGILSHLTWQGVLVSLALVVVIRPLAGRVAYLGSAIPKAEIWAISFLGIRGIGSLYYLAYADNLEAFSNSKTIWGVVVFTILLSILIHGISVIPLLQRLYPKKELPVE